jgi:YfiH family protein
MKLVEKEFCFIIDKIFPKNVVAGFTKPELSGHLPHDIMACLEFLNADLEVAWLNQIHGSTIHKISEAGLYTGDGLFTTANDLVLAVKTADCLPLWVYNETAKEVGVVHMGWRSAQAGILANIPNSQYKLNVLAGTGLRKCCYQVGKEFSDYPEFSGCISRNKLDPIVFVQKNLEQLGAENHKFNDLNLCSLCSDQDFPSYRRDQASERTLSFIVKL